MCVYQPECICKCVSRNHPGGGSRTFLLARETKTKLPTYSTGFIGLAEDRPDPLITEISFYSRFRACSILIPLSRPLSFSSQTRQTFTDAFRMRHSLKKATAHIYGSDWSAKVKITCAFSNDRGHNYCIGIISLLLPARSATALMFPYSTGDVRLTAPTSQPVKGNPPSSSLARSGISY